MKGFYLKRRIISHAQMFEGVCVWEGCGDLSNGENKKMKINISGNFLEENRNKKEKKKMSYIRHEWVEVKGE